MVPGLPLDLPFCLGNSTRLTFNSSRTFDSYALGVVDQLFQCLWARAGPVVGAIGRQGLC